ncbi:MAG: GAF domain-containing protein [Chloroflexota bacterium]
MTTPGVAPERRNPGGQILGVHPSITDRGEIRKTRLLVIVSFILSAGIGVLAGILLFLAPQEILPYLPVLVSSIAVNFVAYLLGRSRHYRLGSWLLLVGLVATGYALVPIRPEDVVDQISATLPIAFVIGSLLFSIPEFIAFVFLNAVIIFSMPTFVPVLETPLMVSQSIIYVILGSIVLVVTTLRNNTERDRLEAASQANQALRAMQDELEARIAERTGKLVEKTSQMRASAEIARRAAALQNPGELLEQVVNLIAAEFKLYHVGIFLKSEDGGQAILQASSSAEGRKMIQDGFRLEIGQQGLVGAVAAERRVRVIPDVDQSAEFLSNSELPDTRSEVALPLIARDAVIGVLDLQSSRPDTFSEDDIDVLQTMADQVALAIENARLLAESSAAIAQLQAIMADNIRTTWKAKSARDRLVYSYTPLGSIIPAGKDDSQSLKIPIHLRGQRIGQIKLQRREDDHWSQREETLIAELATQVGLAIENARLLEEAEQRAEREQLISEITSRATQTLDVEIMLQQLIRELGTALGSANTFIQIGLNDPDEGPLE